MTTFLIYDFYVSANSFLTQQYTRRKPTWKADDAERRAEEEDRVADVVEVEVLDAGHVEEQLKQVMFRMFSSHDILGSWGDDHLRVQRTMKRMTKMAQWRLW